MGNWLHSVTMLLHCSCVGLALFVHPSIRSTVMTSSGSGGGGGGGDDGFAGGAGEEAMNNNNNNNNSSSSSSSSNNGSSLDINAMEQSMLMLSALAVLPLLTIELIGAIIQIQIFLIYIWTDYIFYFFLLVQKYLIFYIKKIQYYIKKKLKKRYVRIQQKKLEQLQWKRPTCSENQQGMSHTCILDIHRDDASLPDMLCMFVYDSP